MYQLDKPDNVVEFLEDSVKNYPKRSFLGQKNKQGNYQILKAPVKGLFYGEGEFFS